MLARGVTAVAAVAGCAAALTLSGCYVDAGALQHRTVSYTVRSPLRALAVHAQLGNVNVSGGGPGRVSVTENITYRGAVPKTTHRASGGKLTLASNCPANETCTVAYHVQVPREMTVSVSVSAGEIGLSALAGPVTAHTNAGDISLSALSGPIEITDHAGSITGRGLSSAHATLSSSVGGIDVAFSAAPAIVTADTTVGSVTVTVPGAVPYVVDARTSVGSVQVGVREASGSPHSITAHTRTGSVTVEPG